MEENEKFQNRYRILSARAKWHNYNGGMYFITICTKNKKYYFGSIYEGEMHFSEIGKFAVENLKNITAHYPYVEIPLFVVMPNHLHAIVIIDGEHSRDVACYVSKEKNRLNNRDVERYVSTGKNEKMVAVAKHQSLLGVMIRGFKSAVTKFANKTQIEFSWQTRFHDHIIRNTNEMNRIASYIENNVSLWESDCYNKDPL